MLKLEAFTPVNASLQTIWRVLLDRIERPNYYLAGVESFSFPEGNEEYAIREIILGGFSMQERITLHEEQGEVRYELLNHPLFEGIVINALIPAAEDDPKALPVVQFRLEWNALTEEASEIEIEAAEQLRESMEQAVHFVRDVAEHLAKQETEAGEGPA